MSLTTEVDMRDDPNAWKMEAACRGMDTEIFFLPEGIRGESRARHERRAQRICNRCPVIGNCQERGKSEPYGVWGGETERDREVSQYQKRVAAAKRYYANLDKLREIQVPEQ